MSTPHSNESDCEKHQRAAELHDRAAEAHRAAAEHHGQQGHGMEPERSRRALEHSQHAYMYTQRVHQELTIQTGSDLYGPDDATTPADEIWAATAYFEELPEDDWFNTEE